MTDDLKFIKRLGKGSFGEVFLSSKKGYTELFATKRIDKKLADAPKVKKYFHNEVAILKEIHHKNIMKLIEFKETPTHYLLVCELCNGGSLTECLDKYRKKNRTNFPEEIVQYLMRQIVDAIKYLHTRKIIHRDLKLDNILVSFDSDIDKDNLNMLKAQAKIIDFGFATHIGGIGGANLAFSTLGSPINMDPLILKKLNGIDTGSRKGQRQGYDEKVDIWSLGTVCYEMLIGKSTFDASDMNELVKKVERGTYTLPPNLSTEAVSFLNAMLQYNGQLRLSADELSRHVFLNKNVKDFKPIDMSKLTNKNRDRRGNLKINVKDNKSIWDVFNEDERDTLAEVSGYCLADHNNGKLETIPVVGNFNINNKNNIPQVNNTKDIPNQAVNNTAKYNNFVNQKPLSPFFATNRIRSNTGNQYNNRLMGPNYGTYDNNRPLPTNQTMGYNNYGAGYNGFNYGPISPNKMMIPPNQNMPLTNNAPNLPLNNPGLPNNFHTVKAVDLTKEKAKEQVKEQEIKMEFIKALEVMNDDFLYIEPLFIPLIPGNDPTVIDPQDEYNDDEAF